MRISKSKFVAGVQCLKRLYLQVHEPELAGELDEARTSVIKQGHEVGLVAQKAFPGGVMVQAKPTELNKALQQTNELVANFTIPAIFEATFQHDDVLVRVDILKRSGRSRYTLTEVKSATEFKPYYAYDLAIQRHVLKGAGFDVTRVNLMHLNRDYVYDGKDYDVSDLFVVLEQRREDGIADREISDRLKEQFRILNRPKPPDIRPGRHCKDPYICEFFEHCNPERPEDHVSLIPNIGEKKLQELMARGITSIKKIPADFPLTERQKRAVQAVKKGRPFVAKELADELQDVKYPLCFMDFETVSCALPRFSGMAPYDHIPFQWSVRRQERPDARLDHYEFLAESSSDPRKPFAASLYDAVAGARTIVVYNEGFEYSRLDDLARWLPAYSSRIEKLKPKLWDLFRVIRRTVYHPDFCGSFSLKSVLPAFVPKMNYENLEISEGIAAGLAWARFIDTTTSAEEKARLKKALLDYCSQDTLAMAKLLEKLRTYV
jgi:predicted RecB family nuclease